jgi:hypothetical protein
MVSGLVVSNGVVMVFPLGFNVVYWVSPENWLIFGLEHTERRPLEV